MKKNRYGIFGSTFISLITAAFFCLAVSASPAWGETVIDPKDWFVMPPGSYWHYSGDGISGSSVQNDNTVTVLDEKKDVGNGVSAARFQMTTDNPADNRNGDEQFWNSDPDDTEGKLLIYGLHNFMEDNLSSGKLSGPQDIILETPLLIGKNGQKIGDVVESSAKTKVMTSSGQLDATVNSKTTYKEILPESDTLLGKFVNILVMNIDIKVSVKVFFSTQTFDVAVGDYLLKEGTGVIANNYKDLAITQPSLKIADRGRVGGIGNVRIQPDSDGLRHSMLVLRTLCAMDSEGVKNLTDINHNGSIGAEEAVYALQKSAGFRLFGLESSAFGDSDAVPAKYTADGENVSPVLAWQNPPSDVLSYVLIADDPDAVPVGGKVWDHWIVYDIPAAAASLAENAGVAGGAGIPSGAKQGTNSYGNACYEGPSPPSGATHHYYFTLYALNAETLNPAGTGKSDIKAAMYGKVSGSAQMVGTYQR